MKTLWCEIALWFAPVLLLGVGPACDPTVPPPVAHPTDGGVTDGGVTPDVGPAACKVPPMMVPQGARGDLLPTVGAPGCLAGEFFVDTAEGIDAPCDDFASRLRDDLNGAFQAHVCDWFPNPACECATDGTGGAWRLAEGTTATVAVEPALPHREGLDQDHRFFRVRFELISRGGGGGEDGPEVATPIDFPDFSLCTVLTVLRAKAEDALQTTCGVAANERADVCGAPLALGRKLLIGRECPSLPADVGAFVGPGSALFDWPARSLGLTTPASPLPEGAAEIALVDTGIDDRLLDPVGDRPRTGLNIRRIEPQGNALFEDAPPRHRHGSAMALLLASAAPGATITSIRALDVNGRGTTASVARAIDAAVHDLPGEAPLVINLSLGWPAELSLPREVSGTNWRIEPATGAWTSDGMCGVAEDGIGETVKYVLAVARATDAREGARPITVIGAAGNRPPGIDAAWGQSLSKLYGGLSCSNRDVHVNRGDHDAVNIDAGLAAIWCGRDHLGVFGAARFFFPAQWSAAPAVWNPLSHACEVLRTVVPASAIDDTERVGVTDPNRAQSSLVAPGERVYVSVPERARLGEPFKGPPAEPVCDDSTGGDPTELLLPQAFSGTSVSSAYLAALAARAQVTWMQSTQPDDPSDDQPPLRRNALARLLYLTGIDVAPEEMEAGGPVRKPRLSVDGVRVRRPSDCRLRAAIANRECVTALSNCMEMAGPRDDAPPIDAALVTCAGTLGAPCRFVDACNDTAPAVAAQWPDAYLPPAGPPGPTCQTTDLSALALDPTPGGPAACAGDPKECMTVYDAGRLGPQPQVGECPDCGLFVSVKPDRLHATAKLVIDIDPTLLSGTTFSLPYVYSFKTGVAYTTNLPTAASGCTTGCIDMSKWVAKARIVVDNINMPVLTSGDAYSNYQFNLFVRMKTPGQTATLDKTPLTRRIILL